MAAHRKIIFQIGFAICFVVVIIGSPRWGTGCSICTSLSPTLCDEIGAADLAAIVRYIETPEVDSGIDDPEAYKSLFQIEEVLKGSQRLGDEETARVLFFPGESAKPGDRYLMHGNWVENDDQSGLVVRWTTPISLTDKATEYLRRMWKFPKNDVRRLVYAATFLRNSDPMLQRDAFDEFGKAPYELLEKLKPELNKDDLIAKIQNPQIPANIKKLYYTLLTICGTKAELPFLESQIEKEQNNASESLPAIIACYLSLSGVEGLPFIEETYLTQEGPDHERRVGAAITALRFHGQEASVIERAKIAEVFVHMIERPTLGARILSDLARWQDWSVVDQVAQMFIDVEGDDLWIREPIVRYLLACPRENAKNHLRELEKIDERAVLNGRRFALPSTMSSVAPSAVPTKKSAESSKSRDSGSPAGKPQLSNISEEPLVKTHKADGKNRSSVSHPPTLNVYWITITVMFVVASGWMVVRRSNKS